MKFNLEQELKYAIEAAKSASIIILDYYKKGFNVEIKSDNSPVTDADKASDKLIIDILKKGFPSYSFLTEESVDDKARLENDFVWIIDPLDGTKDFVAKDDEFTINIALSYKHEAVLGVVYIPVTNVYYYAVRGQGAFKVENGKTTQIHVSDKLDNLTCYISVFHHDIKCDELINKHRDKISKIISKGSSIKACEIAEGKAEITYRCKDGTKEWDTAAFQIIVEEAGGFVLDYDKTPLRYNRIDVNNRNGYIVINNKNNFLI